MDRLHRLFDCTKFRIYRTTTLAITATLLAVVTECAAAEVLREYEASEARQGVAVDAEHFYAIDNVAIGKYRRDTGQRVGGWQQEDPEGPLVHLNAGVVRDGRLYCAHSNFPDAPALSSVEIWDTETMQHVGSHSFGIAEGSLTWVDYHAGHWWACFAHYGGKRQQPGTDPRWTSIVKLDDQWRRLAGWVFPGSVIERMSPYSCSGGCWTDRDELLCTGHDAEEVYVLRLPAAGSVLEHIATWPVPIPGQAIAYDPHAEATPDSSRPQLWGVNRKTKQVRVVTLPTETP